MFVIGVAGDTGPDEGGGGRLFVFITGVPVPVFVICALTEERLFSSCHATSCNRKARDTWRCAALHTVIFEREGKKWCLTECPLRRFSNQQ